MSSGTREQAKELAKIYIENNYNNKKSRTALGLSEDVFRHRRDTARKLGFLPDEPRKNKPTQKQASKMLAMGLDPEQMEKGNYSALDVYDICGGDKKQASKIMGISLEELERQIEIEAKFSGQDEETPTITYPKPKKGKVKRYLLTSAQNNTPINRNAFDNLRAIAKYYNAEFLVGTFSYNKGAYSSKKSVKLGKEPTDDDKKELFYAKEIEDFITDEKIELHENLIWCGHMNTMPTSPNPLSGLEGFTGRSSAIFPHAKIAMDSVASVSKYEATKFNYTTGTVTQRNYVKKPTGFKAEISHGYGGALVEVSDESFWVRQLQTDIHGDIWDVGKRYVIKASKGDIIEQQPVRDRKGNVIGVNEYNVSTKNKVETKRTNIVEAINPGDIHEIHLESWMRKLVWGKKGSIMEYLRPKYQFFHDVIDFRARNHHDKLHPILNYEKHLNEVDDVEKELISFAKFMDYSIFPDCLTVVVGSNHDNAVMRWLEESKANMTDAKNAWVYIKGWEACLKAKREKDRSFNILQWAYQRYSDTKNTANIKFLVEGESFVVCKNPKLRYDGIEKSIHGHIGIGGGRASARTFTKLGRPATTGHTHSCGIVGDVYTAGVMASLDLGYNNGLDKWSQSFVITYPGGSRQIATIWQQKWKAQ